MDTTKNIKNMYQSNYTHEHVIIDITNTKDNTNIKKEEQKTGKKERFDNEEDTTIERKRHKSTKDQVHDIKRLIHFQSSMMLIIISVNILPQQLTILRW